MRGTIELFNATRDRTADESAVQERTTCTAGGQKAKAESGDGSGYRTEPHTDALRKGLPRLRVDASGLVDEYDHDEQQDGSELAGGRRQRDTSDPNSICSGHRADPVKRCAKIPCGWRARGSTRPSPQELSNHGFVTSATELSATILTCRRRRVDPSIISHSVNVGPDVKEHEMITDVYLPLND